MPEKVCCTLQAKGNKAEKGNKSFKKISKYRDGHKDEALLRPAANVLRRHREDDAKNCLQLQTALFI